MAHPYHHSMSSVSKWGGAVEDYQDIHDWFDASKQFIADARHRALRHHSYGIFLCEQEFGITITNSDGRVVPVRAIAERHITEDFGRIPSLNDWLSELPLKPWMLKAQRLSEKYDT